MTDQNEKKSRMICPSKEEPKKDTETLGYYVARKFPDFTKKKLPKDQVSVFFKK